MNSNATTRTVKNGTGSHEDFHIKLRLGSIGIFPSLSAQEMKLVLLRWEVWKPFVISYLTKIEREELNSLSGPSLTCLRRKAVEKWRDGFGFKKQWIDPYTEKHAKRLVHMRRGGIRYRVIKQNGFDNPLIGDASYEQLFFEWLKRAKR